jgi:hypothetical protein
MLVTLAIAGPKPFHKAPKPSAAIVFRAQSSRPEYVPVGALCKRDFRTLNFGNIRVCSDRKRKSK